MGALVALYLLHSYVWIPYQNKQEYIRQQRLKAQLIERQTSEASAGVRKTLVDERQRKLEEEAKVAAARRQELEREKRLKSLGVGKDGITAGNKLGRTATSTTATPTTVTTSAPEGKKHV